MDLSKEDIQKILVIANKYFAKNFNNGATLQEITHYEEVAFKKYIKCYAKNLEHGKTRYNGECKKLRDNWFMLETIKKLYKINNLEKAENLDFCTESLALQTDKLYEYIKKQKYNSYTEEADLEK